MNTIKERIQLKYAFILFAILLFFLSTIAGVWSVQTLARGIISDWGPKYVRRQVLYDKSQILQSILGDIVLSKQLSESQFVRDFANNPESPEMEMKFLQGVERVKKNFRNKNYFVGFLANGHYYHNNSDNDFLGKELRYILNPQKKSNRWFYEQINEGRDIHLHVDTSLELGTTKLWINVLIRDGKKKLGVTGTGLNISSFIKTLTEENEKGITTLFIDYHGSVQLQREASCLNLLRSSIHPEDGTGHNVDIKTFFQSSAEKDLLFAAMKDLRQSYGKKEDVATFSIKLAGRPQFVGIVYLPEIDWYEICMIDLETVLPLSQFHGILLSYIVTLLLTIIFFCLALFYFILRPLHQLDRAVANLDKDKELGDFFYQKHIGEMARLAEHMNKMSHYAVDFRRKIEQKVRERTQDLEQAADIDPLTELFNRRGMTKYIAEKMVQMSKKNSRRMPPINFIGLLWLDIDHFKDVNDVYGHAAGDEALVTVSKIIKQTIRDGDLASRWGGDEFVIMIETKEKSGLDAIAERLRVRIEQSKSLEGLFRLSVSIGGSLFSPDQSFDEILDDADTALYEAKKAGRNCYRFHSRCEII